MQVRKTIIILILIFGLILASGVLIITLIKSEWNTVAASLAVITAVIGSWSAQRIIFKQEDELEPQIQVSLDIRSRRGVVQLILENVGGSSAHNVKIIWKKPLIDYDNKEVHFISGYPDIDFRRITKGQKYSCLVDGTTKLYEKLKKESGPMEFFGTIIYNRRENGKVTKKEDFFLTMEPQRTSLNSEDELQEFLAEGSKIHKDFRELNTTLKKILPILEEYKKPGS